MPWAAAIGAVGAIGGALIGGNASQSAAQTQANAANQATQTQLQMFDQTQANLQPYMQQGQIGLNQLNQLMTNPNSITQLPGYQFQMQQGTDAIQNSAAANGLTGNTLKSLASYGQGLANQDFSQFWNQAMQQANLGQTSAAGVGNIGASTANAISSNQIGAGNALAAGQVGQATAINGGINNAMQNWLLAQSMQSGGSGANAPGYGSVGSSFGSADYSLSDRRLKTDIKRVGYTDGGLPIYVYRFARGGPPQMGVMAQDVAAVDPSAVIEVDGGFLAVDYSKVS